MANKHLKNNDEPPKEEKTAGGARHTKRAVSAQKAKAAAQEKAREKAAAKAGTGTKAGSKAAAKTKTGTGAKTPAKSKASAGTGAGQGGRQGKKPSRKQEQVVSLTDALAAQVEASIVQSRGRTPGAGTPAADGSRKDAAPKGNTSNPGRTASRRGKTPDRQTPDAGGETRPDGPEEAKRSGKKGSVAFRREKAKPLPDERKPMLSHRDRVGAVISLIAAVVLLAATAVVWLYKDSFSPEGVLLSADTAAVAREEYVFDAGSGEAFAAAGKGLAVANTSGFELLDADGTAVTSMVMQMENPAATGCDSYAVFYDLGGRRLAAARFDGSVEEIDTEGNILSATVSEGGYLAVTTEQTGYRALVTVYDPNLDEVYKWYSSSAWVISATVSPDSRRLAVLSYTASGSEVRFFRLNDEEQTASFQAEGTVLLDIHWFTSGKLCALSSEQMLFFSSDGEQQSAYSFDGRYLVGYTFDGSNCAAIALSPYRAGTTATLVSLDPNGEEMGTAEVQSEIVCLTAADLEVMVLCSDGAVLYNSSLTEKGRLTGLPGFKYGLLRDRGEALLIASNYAEVYTF